MKKLVSIILALCLLIGILATSALACSTCTTNSYVYRAQGYVYNCDAARLRSCANVDPDDSSYDYTIIGQIYPETDTTSADTVNILRQYARSSTNVWYYVRVTSGINTGNYGWVDADYIKLTYEEMSLEVDS